MKRIFAIFLFPLALQATELAPWYGRSLEIEVRGTALLQNFNSIATPIEPTRYPSFSQFYTLSAASSYARIAAELELTLANTPHRSFGFDAFRATGRYIVLDDVIGDKISLTFGTTLCGAGKKALRDLSSFHHGLFEIEGHMAFGREVPCLSYWLSRWWGVFAVGTAIEGRPWLRGHFTWERNFWDIHSFQAFVHTLFGLGDFNIDLNQQFLGYGLIQHRSVDLGLRYTALVGCFGGSLSLEFAQRVYAFNFPENASQYLFRFTYPFGL